MAIKPQDEFPLWNKYEEKFKLTYETIFAYDGNIYTNYKLTDDLLVHENVHLRQQKEIGVDVWVDKYLNDVQFRLDQEIEAYKEQLKSISDSKKRSKMVLVCAQNLSSDLYGGIISLREAFDVLVRQ